MAARLPHCMMHCRSTDTWIDSHNMITNHMHGVQGHNYHEAFEAGTSLLTIFNYIIKSHMRKNQGLALAYCVQPVPFLCLLCSNVLVLVILQRFSLCITWLSVICQTCPTLGSRCFQTVSYPAFFTETSGLAGSPWKVITFNVYPHI